MGRSMDKIEFRKIGSLRLHPDNVKIFGLPTDESNYEEIREDIRERGLQEPLIILDNGTILSGHIRYSGVWWTLEQDGLTVAQIKEELIAIRVHEDFASKEEELIYLMKANLERRQMDPRRIAISIEKLEQIVEASAGDKKKKGEAFRRLADRFGITLKLATTYRTIFGSKIVPEEYKDSVNSKTLAPTTVLEAIKFAEESAQRERRAPSPEDVVIYLKNPKSAKSTLASTLREAAKAVTTTATTSAHAPKPPVPEPKPAPAIVEAPKAPEPPKVEPTSAAPVEVHSDPTPAIDPSIGVHIGHCCSKHGCKYDDRDCPVVSGQAKQSGPCEQCGLISEGYFDEDLPEEEMIPYAHRLLKKSLGTVTLDDELRSELIGIHTELGSYLEAMGLITRSSPMTIPASAPDRIAICVSLVESIIEVEDASATRDALLELVSLSKVSIERLTTTKRELEPNGLFCPECLEPQFNSPSGATCSKGHGGLTGITEGQAGQIKLSQELSEEKFKCCFCGSQVETADNYATHANCPKCGLVDTSDIEPVVQAAKPKTDELEIDQDLLDEVINSEQAQVTEPAVSKSDISSDELAALLGQEEEPKKVPENKVEPKKIPVAPVKSNGVEDPDSAFVTSMIDDFEVELQKAGVVTTA
jgi:hypothetical protein